MSTTTLPDAGRIIAERLGMTILGKESHNLKVACVSCQSSDAGRVHSETGVYFCFSCQKALNAFDLCKVKLGDYEAAKKLMHDVGLFPELFEKKAEGNGNGKTEHIDPIGAVAAEKRCTPEGLRAFGATAKNGKVVMPMHGPDGQVCSTFTMTPGAKGDFAKGLYEKGKPVGLFLPEGRTPKAGETWIVVEGPKDAAALYSLEFKNVVGLPTNAMNAKFAELFRGVHVVIIPDADKPGHEGAKKTTNVLKGKATSIKIVTLPVPVSESKGADVRDVIAQHGVDAVRKAIDEAKPAEGAELPEPIDYGFIGGADLLAMDCRIEYLIPGVLAKGQHCLLGAPLKSCKSLIAIDQAIALATGGTFLGRFHVPRPVRTLLISLESGWPVLQENIRRISRAAGVSPEQLGNLFIAIRGPKFGKQEHLEAITQAVKQHDAEVVIIDCAYRCIPGDVASNVLSMGELLDSVGGIFEASGATLELVHHSPKHIPPGDPLQLDNLAFAGFAEFAAQWLLVNRRTAYQPGTGHHELWLTIGARAGHGGLYGLTIDEGEFHQGQDREWWVELTQAQEVWKETRDTRAKAREAKRLEKLEGLKKRIIDIAAKFKTGETKTNIRDLTGLGDKEFKAGFSALLEAGDLVPCEVQKSNRKAPYPGYLLALYATP